VFDGFFDLGAAQPASAVDDVVLERTSTGVKVFLVQHRDGKKHLIGRLGALKWAHNKAVYEVALSAAVSGFGPLLYEVAAQAIYPATLVPDQSTLSAEAEKVWKRFDARLWLDGDPALEDGGVWGWRGYTLRMPPGPALAAAKPLRSLDYHPLMDTWDYLPRVAGQMVL
jgi:hypothetical protein